MELLYVIAADAAESSPNGKFSLLGGGIENIFALAFPAIQPRFTLVIGLRALKSEAEQEHKFHLDIRGPKDFYASPGVIAPFMLNPLSGVPDLPTTVNLVINMSPVVFPEPGIYLFHLYVDNQEVGTFPLNVQKANTDEDSNS